MVPRRADPGWPNKATTRKQKLREAIEEAPSLAEEQEDSLMADSAA
jgi:hypothetical protein